MWDAIPRLAIHESQNTSRNLRVHVRRLNRGYDDRNSVYAPKFPKSQHESWFVVAFVPAGDRLLALERLSMSGRGGAEGSVELKIPENFTGDSLVVKVLSDGWRGVDVEKTVAWTKATIAVDV